MATVAKDQQVPQSPCFLEGVIMSLSLQSREDGDPNLSMVLDALTKNDSDEFLIYYACFSASCWILGGSNRFNLAK